MVFFPVTLGMLLVFAPGLSFQQQCTTSNDIGGVSCELFTPYYSEHQWATCLTNEYIMRSSNQRHQCRQLGASQCWYQCMLEIYGLDEGEVNEDCRCSPGEVMTEAPTDDLPPHCYSPRGDDCSWYRHCLEMRYPCEGTSDGYAIRYAEKFCNLYTDNYNDFSSDGRAWIDGVRKCLQVVLVPSLRPWVQKTCSDIRGDAFNSHPGCYINPANGAPGICELSCTDVLRSFWLVSYEGGALTSAFAETTNQMWSVMVGCFGDSQLSGCIPAAQTALIISIPFVPISQRLAAATAVITFLANRLNWISNGFRWIPFLDNDDSDSDNRRKRDTIESDMVTNFDVRLLLADEKILNISNGTDLPQTRGHTLDQAIEDLSNAVRNGDLSQIPLIVNDTQMTLTVLSVGQCTDISCNSTDVKELATAPPPSSAETCTLFVHLHYIMTLISVIIVVYFFSM